MTVYCEPLRRNSLAMMTTSKTSTVPLRSRSPCFLTKTFASAVPISPWTWVRLGHVRDAARQGVAVSREELMLEVWGTAVIGRSRSLDFFMGQIRAKLAGLPLQTVRGFGFRLDS